ncbi:MAG: CehA/McbA family metallohydrolase, partial [Acidobacteriota bacterium]|nr:CehA/McbA family metallohydrolase [Acidobacteriota bacterium]
MRSTADPRSDVHRMKATLAGAIALLVLLSTGSCDESGAPHEPAGTLVLTVRDAATGEPTSARVELLDEGGLAVIPEDALTVFSDCRNLPVHAWVPGFEVFQAMRHGHRAVSNPYTGTTQFYADGSIEVRLPTGAYSVRATKGIEYKRSSNTVLVEEGRVTRLDLDLDRWIDLPREGWFGADDHLHIPRPHPRFDRRLATWMEAEGLHVANFLQMGLAQDVHITPQHRFGRRSVYQRGDVLLLSGQENPRTHVLGHTIVLGAHSFIDMPDQYLLYDRVWEEAHGQGAINGYAHWGLAGAEEGLAVWGHDEVLDFVEVLNLGFPFYDRWYEALNLGFRIGPTAGTDYPCLPGLPGRERFYAKLDGPLNADAWLEAVRRGRTFVTNGPAIEFSVEGTLPGEELLLAAPGEVRVKGRVRFDPDRDAVAALELVRGGEVELRVNASTMTGEIRLETILEVEKTTWLALRATGEKRGETEIDLRSLFSTMLVLERHSNEGVLNGLPTGVVPRRSAAHTGAILVTVEGTPPLADQPRGKAVAHTWLARLDELERRLDDERMGTWARFPGRGDGIDLRTALANRSALLDEIEAARQHYEPSRP